MEAYNAELAILYNLEADESVRAVSLYVLMLVDALRIKHPDHVIRYIDKWRSTLLPDGLSVGYKLFVRAYQLSAFTEYKLDTAFLVQDIDVLLDQATDNDGWGILALAVQSLREFRTQDPVRTMRYIQRSAMLQTVYKPDGQEITLDVLSIPEMLWLMVTNLSSPILLRQWLEVVISFTDLQKAKFWMSELGRRGIWLVPNKIFLTEWKKSKSEQDWGAVLREFNFLLPVVQQLNQPRVEAVLIGMMLEILEEAKRIDEIPSFAEVTLARWPNDPDVQFMVRGTWGRVYAYQKRSSEALELLDAALSQKHSRNDHERLRCLLAANYCIGPKNLCYAKEARDLARSSNEAPDSEVARALGEYALAKFTLIGGQEGSIHTFDSWSEAIKRLLEISEDKIWRDLTVLFAHVTAYLSKLAWDGIPQSQTNDGDTFVAPSRGFLMKEYSPEREAIYRESAKAGIYYLMASYANASRSPDESIYWAKLAIDEARRVGASTIQVANGDAIITGMLETKQFEDALETGLFSGRGMVAYRGLKSRGVEIYEGTGYDLNAEFDKLSETDRQLGDLLAFVNGVLPIAIALVRISTTDSEYAVRVGLRVAAMCREIAENNPGDQELWLTTAELFATTSVSRTNTSQILSVVETVAGQDERSIALGVLSRLLATWHASPHDAIQLQLSIIEVLFRWYPIVNPLNLQVIVPYFMAYWLHSVQHCRFAFRTPDLTSSAIEAAQDIPEINRIHAVLTAIVNGCSIRGATDILDRIKN